MPPITEQQIRQTAVLCHLAAFLGMVIPLGSLFGPLAVWLVKRADDPFIDENGREAVNFQLSKLIYFVVLIFVGIVTTFGSVGGMMAGSGMDSSALSFGAVAAMFGSFGLIGIGLLAVFLLGLICPIIAALKADKGESFRYPVTMRFVR
ncbi:MAG: DUF4870 domain-containing protein [Ardenticatenales bacterium]|nr:DUF4870 domain-containing protein [Ardenticatenales bacterium]